MPINEPSSLVRIRQAERELLRLVEAAEQAASERLAETRRETKAHIARARRAGRKRGEIDAQEAIASAGIEAEDIRSRAERLARERRALAETHIEALCDRAFQLLIAGGEGADHAR